MSSAYPQNPFSTTALSPPQLEAYLRRLSLPPTVLSESSPPSLALLTQLYTAQNESIPKDTSPLHVPVGQWSDASAPIVLGSALGSMPVGAEAYVRIVEQGAGAFCFGTNGTFAQVLRAFGFRVSEVATRVYLGRGTGEDPTTHRDGFHWGTLTHIVLLCDWEGSDGRYLVDAGWGPASQTLPIKLEHRVPSPSLCSYEAFELRNEELPLSPWMPKPIDMIKGWTLYRYITPPDTPIAFPISDATPGYWSPHLHFLPISMPHLDLVLYSHFSATHPDLAFFTAKWLICRQIPGTGGARRTMVFGERGDPQDQRKAKVFTTGGHEGRGSKQGRDVEWVSMQIGPMREYLAKEFGFIFP